MTRRIPYVLLFIVLLARPAGMQTLPPLHGFTAQASAVDPVLLAALDKAAELETSKAAEAKQPH